MTRTPFDITSACAACRGRKVRHTCTRVRRRRCRGYAPVPGCGGCARRHVRHTCTDEERAEADAAQAAAVQAAADAAAEREAARVAAAAAAEREAFNAERGRECAICLDPMLDDDCLVRHGACRHWWHYVCIEEYIADHADPEPPCPHCGDILGL
jgi:hypothetical protein